MAAQSSIVTTYGLMKNNAAIGDGGGIASIDKAVLVLGHGSVFHGNNAGGSGGSVYAAGTSVTFGELKVKSFCPQLNKVDMEVIHTGP